MKQSKDTWRLICFAATGTIELETPEGNQAHLSGSPSDPQWFLRASHWWADPEGEYHQEWDKANVPSEGVPVLDKRAALETPAGYKWVFSGPMCDARLKDGEIDALPEVSPLMAPVIAAYGMAGCLIETRKAQAQRKAGALDSVSVAEYVRGWVEHGARLGRFFVNPDNSGRIEWADGEVETCKEAPAQPWKAFSPYTA